MSSDIYSGDALLVGDRCIVRPEKLAGVVEEVPSLSRRTYLVRLEDGRRVAKEWLLLDRIRPKKKPRNPSYCGRVVEWDAHPGSVSGRTPSRRATT